MAEQASQYIFPLPHGNRIGDVFFFFVFILSSFSHPFYTSRYNSDDGKDCQSVTRARMQITRNQGSNMLLPQN